MFLKLDYSRFHFNIIITIIIINEIYQKVALVNNAHLIAIALLYWFPPFDQASFHDPTQHEIVNLPFLK